jgi:hypothetical protein
MPKTAFSMSSGVRRRDMVERRAIDSMLPKAAERATRLWMLGYDAFRIFIAMDPETLRSCYYFDRVQYDEERDIFLAFGHDVYVSTAHTVKPYMDAVVGRDRSLSLDSILPGVKYLNLPRKGSLCRLCVGMKNLSGHVFYPPGREDMDRLIAEGGR